MTKRYSAAHWGTYQIDTPPGASALRPINEDPLPSIVGKDWLASMRDTRMRILKPAVRKGWLQNRDRHRCQNDSFVEVGWDEALDLVADELATTKSELGNSGIFGGSYGWASAGRFHHAQSQLKRFLNTIGGFTSSVNTYSHAAAEVLFPHIVGMTKPALQDKMTTWPSINKHCELLVAFGGISTSTSQIESGGTSVHEVSDWLGKLAANSVEIINISPQRDDLGRCNKWIMPRPGTDTALMLGIAYELYRAELVDRRFLEKYTHGAETLERYILGSEDGLPKTPKWASEICDVSADAIIDLAHKMASKKTLITLAWSLQRADHGEQPVWMGLALAAMLGEIGQPGLGFSFGYGSTAAVGRPTKLIPWPSLPQGKNAVDHFIPVSRITDLLENPGASFSYNGKEYKYPEIRMVYWAGGNPFHHHQDLNALQRAWERPQTIVVNDHTWTATARRADIVLPSTSALERSDFMLNKRDPSIIFMTPAMKAVGESRNDYDIFAGLAERFGTADRFTEGKTESDWLRWLWDQSTDVAREFDITLPTFEAFHAAGMFRCPGIEEERILFGDYVRAPSENPLRTKSGKIELYSEAIADMKLDDCPPHPCWLEPAERLGACEEEMLHLISHQPRTRLHGQLDHGSVSINAKIEGREPCLIHPSTAESRGILEGDLVLLENDRGACLAGAVISFSKQIRPDCIALATGATFDPIELEGKPLEVHGNPNVLTIDKGASQLSQGNIAHTTLVKLSKWNGEAPNLRIDSPPALVRN